VVLLGAAEQAVGRLVRRRLPATLEP
jgi:hypothetical protein